MAWVRPATDAVRDALRGVAPRLAGGDIGFVAEGWEFWAFEVGGYLVRFPKNEVSVTHLRLERVVLPAIGEHVSVRVPRIEVWGEEGPNGAPFAVHGKLPGVHVWPNGDAPLGKPSADFGRQLGSLIRQLHAFPVQKAQSS